MDEDFLLAIRLQAEYDNERARSACDDSVKIVHATSKQAPGAGSARPRDMSVVDPTWELLDPSPDIRALFLQFNDMFFWGKLAGVEVKWSPRMTLCAGVCSYEGRGGLCSVRLSEPLLKLRPRKDLVETLLHEMIHALLFVTHNNKDHDSHGPEFCKHMNRINDLTGAKISVYHSFHDEVDEYRKHWWLCNGPCQKRKPYYGYVKRAMNRPPSAADPWWSEHQQSCGGKFTKVKEPEKYVQKDVKKDGSSKAKPGSLDGKGKCHGVDIRTIIPFSGTGYKLVETNASGVPPKVQQIGSSSELHKPLPHSPSGPVILNNKSLLPSREKSVSTMGSARKVSVANANVFINVNGSPIKLPTERTSTTQGQSSTSRIGGFFFPGQKNFSKTSVPSATKPSTSQAKNHVESTGQPAKRPRLEDKKTLDSFFIKSPRGNVLKGELVPKVSRATTPAATATSAPAATATSAPAATATASSTNQQSMKVSCPVCRTAVLESDINQHLDVCLAAS